MHAAVVHPRMPALALGLAFGAMLAVAGPVGAMHLDLEQSCTALVATEGGEPGPSATVRVGEVLEVHGLFPRGEDPETAPELLVRLSKDGVERSVLTVEQDIYDEFLLELVFEPGDEGQWQILAFPAVDGGCGGPADVTVLASAAQPSPTPSPGPAAMPDTANVTDAGAAPPMLLLGAFAVLLLGLAASTVLHRSVRPPKRAGD
jgi:hypothetical protein